MSPLRELEHNLANTFCELDNLSSPQIDKFLCCQHVDFVSRLINVFSMRKNLVEQVCKLGTISTSQWPLGFPNQVMKSC